MSWLSRIINVVRSSSLRREIDEEFASHVAEAIEQGRDPEEARRALGSALQQRKASRDVKVVAWLDFLRADMIFGWRQIMKRKVTSAAAILSLVLAIGSCTSAFRLVDAMLLRPLPIAGADRFYELLRQGTGFDGKPATYDARAYPSFQRMRSAAKGQAELTK